MYADIHRTLKRCGIYEEVGGSTYIPITTHQKTGVFWYAEEHILKDSKIYKHSTWRKKVNG